MAIKFTAKAEPVKPEKDSKPVNKIAAPASTVDPSVDPESDLFDAEPKKPRGPKSK